MKVRMVDVSPKPKVYREAIASGKIVLKKKTIELVKSKKIEKGDVLSVATVAAILAAKKTSEIIPLCHPIPLTHVDVDFSIEDNFIEVKTKVRTTAKTGVEMEALAATMTALLTIWDMVKKYEKDEKGQYPETVITDVRVLAKIKGEK
ncbi:MAG: cyclic pyranopterin monophosphate synthase MoaC [Thermoprotei archaeon]|nr:MAG: cyclic pyranopterin monophosphate synthase MoaC [Thermoprotei archaeon]